MGEKEKKIGLPGNKHVGAEAGIPYVSLKEGGARRLGGASRLYLSGGSWGRLEVRKRKRPLLVFVVVHHDALDFAVIRVSLVICKVVHKSWNSVWVGLDRGLQQRSGHRLLGGKCSGSSSREPWCPKPKGRCGKGSTTKGWLGGGAS